MSFSSLQPEGLSSRDDYPGELGEERTYPNETLSAVVDRLADETAIAPEVWAGSRALLDTLARHNPATYAHSLRVGYYNYGLELQKSDDADPAFALLAATVHDVGKIGIDNGVLDCRGNLTPIQWESIRRHPEIGAHLLADVDRNASLVAHLHHKFQPGGYGIDLQEAMHTYGRETAARAAAMACQVMLVDVFDSTLIRRDRGSSLGGQSVELQQQRLLQRFPERAAELDWLFDHRLETDSTEANPVSN